MASEFPVLWRLNADRVSVSRVLIGFEIEAQQAIRLARWHGEVAVVHTGIRSTTPGLPWPPVAELDCAPMRIRSPEPGDTHLIVDLAATVVGDHRAAALVRAHIERGHLLVAEHDREAVGFLAYRTDWFQCTFVSLVVVTERARRRGVARALFEEVERRSPSARLFSSTEETNAVSIQMHRALGFVPSGHIDNLPQGYRELLFYKRLRR